MSNNSKQEIRGSALRIGDKLVIDKDANVITSNIYCNHVIASITTNSLVEQNSMKGIEVFGNVVIKPGHSLSVDSLMSNDGRLFIDGTVKITDQLLCDSLSTSKGLIQNLTADALLASNGTDISILGSVVLLESKSVFCGNIATDHVASISGGPISLSSGLTLIEGSIVVPKSTSEPSHTNVISTNTMAGTLYCATKEELSGGDTCKVRILNKYIRSDSVIIALTGKYMGVGLPIVCSTVPAITGGSADLHIGNLDPYVPIPQNALIPLHYLII